MAIEKFISFVEKQPGNFNVEIIYYCGHGIASQAGSRYFVPGNIDISTYDTTYEVLSDKLINLDTIKHLIIDAQIGTIKSRYIIMGDCCSEQDFSKWYKGIAYGYFSDSSGNNTDVTIQYNDTALKRLMQYSSMLKASPELTFSDLIQLL